MDKILMTSFNFAGNLIDDQAQKITNYLLSFKKDKNYQIPI